MFFRLTLLTLGCAMATAIVAPHANAETTTKAPGGALLIQWDNDKVVDTDRHYTNGSRLAYAFGETPEVLLPLTQSTAEWLGFDETESLRTGIVFGHDMYTPEVVDAYVPDPLDRPYAGWMYAGFFAQGENANRQDTYELNLGVIGPAAKAGQLQNAFHRLINVSVSRGWRSQINNEPGVMLTRTAKFRTDGTHVYGGVDYDAIAHATGQLGNVRTGASMGATVRLGQRLDQDFGPVYGSFALPHARTNDFVWSVFAGGEVRAVAWDVFLDGNAFQDSPDVDKNPLILEGRVGFATQTHWDCFLGTTGGRFSVNLVHRTREFTTQDKADRYGSAQLTLFF